MSKLHAPFNLESTFMKLAYVLASIAVMAPLAVSAQAPSTGKAPAMRGMESAAPPAASFPMSQGEVLKVNPKSVLLKHGPLANLGMDSMTMQFGVADPAILNSVKKGDKVRFVADRINGQFVVTKIEALK
jgi:Cu(I)/Ag(I) efflux system periplasmic protein CusF